MKIQIKRSNVLENGVAKEPTTAQMEYGELALNYNSIDPALFFEDSAGSIRRIGGKNSVTSEWESTGDELTTSNPNASVTIPGSLTVNAGATLRGQLIEKVIIGSGAPGTIDLEPGNVHYYTTAGAGAITLNFRRNAAESLDSSLAVGETVAITVLATTTDVNYYVTTVQVDGVAQTVKWIGAEAPTESAGAGVDAYSFQVIKTAANTFTVFGSVNNFG